MGAWLLAGWATAQSPSDGTGGGAGTFDSVVRPFLERHCVACHGPDERKGQLRLDTLEPDFGGARAAAQWKEVVDALLTHAMPPEEEPQPPQAEMDRITDWLAAELGKGEIAGRSAGVVLRRLNRSEYNRTIQDLTGVTFEPAAEFPEDTPAGGFDNIGEALTLSPLHLELYFEAARRILDRALISGEAPVPIRWRFDPEENTAGDDRLRVKRDGQQILLNDGENRTEGPMTVVHHNAWNTGVGFRGFKVPAAGPYLIRFRAAGRIPDRTAVVSAASTLLDQQFQRQMKENPKGKVYHEEHRTKALQHFRESPLYSYGPPRVKVIRDLGGTPMTVAELDVPAVESSPGEYEIPVWMTPSEAGIRLEAVYSVPKSLENFWMQEKPEFARPLLLLDWIELEGPIHPEWPPASHRKTLAGDPLSGAAGSPESEGGRAREVLQNFMIRAYRRPLRPGELESKWALYQRVRPEKISMVEALKIPMAAVLASPHFLYLVETGADPEAAGGGTGPNLRKQLNGYELATRLSYFLWSTLPDADLFEAAGAGNLSQPPLLRKQVLRMLRDSKSRALVRNFTGQWLGLRKVGANPPAQELYPEYDRHLEVSMIRESEEFFAEILDSNLDVRNFLKSDFVTINERLARFYGIPGVVGDHIRKVPAVPGSHRGGLVTHASFHSLTSNGTRTSPVLRGVWVLRTLLGRDPGLPVANAGEIANQIPGIDKATVRQRLAMHRESISCARCHNKIDPLGLALENFNAAGQWRDQEGFGYQGRIQENDPRIDATAVMPDGTPFEGVEGLQEQLLRQSRLFLENLVSQLFTYALGREMGFSDRPVIQAIAAQAAGNGFTLQEILLGIVFSEAFQTKH